QVQQNTRAKGSLWCPIRGHGGPPGATERRFLARSLLLQRASGGALMLYQPGDYVYPADLPRPIVCRVEDVESLRVGREVSQVLKLEPLEGPWPAGTLLIRLDAAVVPVPARTLWRGRGLPPATRPCGSCSTRREPGWSRGITTRSSPSRASVRPSTSTPTISADACARRVRPATGGDDGRTGLDYGKLRNRSLKSVAFAASPSIGLTPKISSTVRSVEQWVWWMGFWYHLPLVLGERTIMPIGRLP